ncbi:LacI family DNA-binding transcriptional regulator [Piscinibacter sakaiensis]|uniref:Putative L-talarate utilization transcriptional regulator, LacI family n=1 Tax=Piscinibacter sakaiensis TaxID=1547922 RepID=A0A0K8NUP1_PISS1|nr:LacI family DNA-binding transcriptional regulator [Piscinibacter sakaiensis]GAP34088.1 putative L-talarate utilization transcriptional regulator, LacI family [Piscinibacter sakaiensis]
MPAKIVSKSVTLQDVARAAGVSPITASRALSQPDLVSKETLARVHQAVDATGYIPNLLAGGLKSKRSTTIGALVPFIAVPQFLSTMQTLTQALERGGYQLVIGETGYAHERESVLVDTFLGRRVDGIVVAGLLRNGAVKERLRRLDVPVVETWDLTDKPCDMLVGFSHVAVGSAVAGYFRGKGWTDVAMASGNDERALRRREGFVAAMGHDVPTAYVQAPSNLALGRAALSELLERGVPTRAVFCSSDGLAQGVLIEALARGLRVPQDLAIVGFGGADFAAHLEPALTTVQIDGAAIGTLAAQRLLARCRDEPVDPPVLDVGFKIIERSSSAGAPLQRS